MMAKQSSMPRATPGTPARAQVRPRTVKALTASNMGALLALAQRMVDNSASEQAQNFDTERWLRQWLAHPNPALGGARPIDLLATQAGTQSVRQLLAAMESGAYL